MASFLWNEEKNQQLIRDRGISFQEIVSHLNSTDLLAVLVHSNQERYPGQRIFVVRIGDYAYEVPFLESDGIFLLKTVFPSRKATRDYLRRRSGDV